MRSKYNMVKTNRVKYSWSKWEDERLPRLRGLERAPSLAGVERRTSGPHRRAQWDTYRTGSNLDVVIRKKAPQVAIEILYLMDKCMSRRMFSLTWKLVKCIELVTARSRAQYSCYFMILARRLGWLSRSLSN
jgi:hypothetical protein